MNKKLTLNIDESIIQFAHNYSKITHQSISSIVENYFYILKNSKEDNNFSNSTNELYGILENNPLPDKAELRGAFYEKSIN